MQTELVPVKKEEKEILRNLLEKYNYEFSQYEGTKPGPLGLFGYDYLDNYWTEEHRWPFFIRADGELAGFALINDFPEAPGTETDYSMAEFFVLYPYRRKGVGKEAAFRLFDRFHGRWQLKRHPQNTGSVRFWNQVVGEYTGGDFRLEKSLPGTEYGDGSAGDVFFFETAAPTPPKKRSEQEFLNLFLDFAKTDLRVRAVGMEASRLNAQVPPDGFRDFDLTFFVTEMDSFTRDDGWLDRFGERLILQKPEGMELFPAEEPGFSYLMLFADFNKADLTLLPVGMLGSYLKQDSLRAILLDKDGLVKDPPVPSDKSYWIQKPSARSFDDCCNEFWNLSHYVAKGICRKELFYAADHLALLREELFRMLEWEIGAEKGFHFSLGKKHKFLSRYLAPEAMRRLERTYNLGTLEDIRQALDLCRDLFSESARKTAALLGYSLPDYGEKVGRYLDYYLKG